MCYVLYPCEILANPTPALSVYTPQLETGIEASTYRRERYGIFSFHLAYKNLEDWFTVLLSHFWETANNFFNRVQQLNCLLSE